MLQKLRPHEQVEIMQNINLTTSVSVLIDIEQNIFYIFFYYLSSCLGQFKKIMAKIEAAGSRYPDL